MPDSTNVKAMPPLSSHDRILLSAKRLFALNGYENTSTVAIAREAGTSESQLMKHFGSKRGLLAAILDRGWNGILGQIHTLPANSDPGHRLTYMVETFITELENDPDLKVLMVLEAGRVRKDNRDVIVGPGFQQFAEALLVALREMRDQGHIRPDMNLEAVRAAILGMTEGLLYDQVLAQRSEYRATYTSDDAKKVLGLVISTCLTEGSGQPLKAANG